nr:thiamine ABC transporter substrate-binding protein [Bdellovibrionales bacterium]
RFKQENDVNVEVVTAGDAGLLLERLKIAQSAAPFDIVIGLDQLMLPDAEKEFKWREMFFGSEGRHPVISEYASPRFVPFDWSPLTFVYHKAAGALPAEIDDLLKPELKGQFALQDPRSSSPGLQFFHWIKSVKGPRTVEFLERFKPNVNSVSPSWAFSYGLFKKDQTRFVWSYLTSLAYHWGAESNRDYQVLSFRDGHPVQVEYAAVPSSCRECDLAEKFVGQMLQPWAQKLIMEKNFMFPVIKGLEEGTIFGQLPELKTIRTGVGKDLGDWDQAFRR